PSRNARTLILFHCFFMDLILVSLLADEIMQQDIRPLLAVDIIEQLHRQFAVLAGGRGKDGAPIITFPEYSGFSEVSEEDFLNVVTYLTSIPRCLCSHTLQNFKSSHILTLAKPFNHLAIV
uniref:MCF.2 cell line derived transforming sequence-like 2 n=1 Tax=Kryptolebias marmoratus TaxID=37003 RepID=A0A3Q3FS67_KRYMA